MEFVRTHVDGSRTRVYTEKGHTSGNIASTEIVVSNVAEFEAAAAAIAAGQFVYIRSGSYQLTALMTIPIAGNAGGFIGLGEVEILGVNGVDAAIKILTTDATGTFEFTFAGRMSIKGGSGKNGLEISNAGTSQKTIIYVKDEVHFEDNGAGKGLVISNTGTGAVRLYVTCRTGTGWDSVDITNKNADDKWRFRGINFEEDFDAAVVNVADNWLFQDCQLKHAGMDGGHATNVVNVVNCFTIESTAVAAADASDFPGAFNPTIV